MSVCKHVHPDKMHPGLLLLSKPKRAHIFCPAIWESQETIVRDKDCVEQYEEKGLQNEKGTFAVTRERMQKKNCEFGSKKPLSMNFIDTLRHPTVKRILAMLLIRVKYSRI